MKAPSIGKCSSSVSLIVSSLNPEGLHLVPVILACTWGYLLGNVLEQQKLSEAECPAPFLKPVALVTTEMQISFRTA